MVALVPGWIGRQPDVLHVTEGLVEKDADEQPIGAIHPDSAVAAAAHGMLP